MQFNKIPTFKYFWRFFPHNCFFPCARSQQWPARIWHGSTGVKRQTGRTLDFHLSSYNMPRLKTMMNQEEFRETDCSATSCLCSCHWLKQRHFAGIQELAAWLASCSQCREIWVYYITPANDDHFTWWRPQRAKRTWAAVTASTTLHFDSASHSTCRVNCHLSCGCSAENVLIIVALY